MTCPSYECRRTFNRSLLGLAAAAARKRLLLTPPPAPTPMDEAKRVEQGGVAITAPFGSAVPLAVDMAERSPAPKLTLWLRPAAPFTRPTV